MIANQVFPAFFILWIFTRLVLNVASISVGWRKTKMGMFYIAIHVFALSIVVHIAAKLTVKITPRLCVLAFSTSSVDKCNIALKNLFPKTVCNNFPRFFSRSTVTQLKSRCCSMQLTLSQHCFFNLKKKTFFLQFLGLIMMQIFVTTSLTFVLNIAHHELNCFHFITENKPSSAQFTYYFFVS